MRSPVDVHETVMGFADVVNVQLPEVPGDWENEPLSNSTSAPFPQVMLPENGALPLFQTVREKVNSSPA